MTPEKEKELLTALSKGNQSAFDSLYLFYAPKVREFVFRLLKNPGEAEDVTQNIFLRVWEKRRELGGTRSLRSYLYTMARNAVFDIFSHSIVEDKYMQEHINSAAERRDAPLSEKIETEELALLIAVAVDRMPEQRRRVFSLSRYEELSNKEIAERLKGLTVKIYAKTGKDGRLFGAITSKEISDALKAQHAIDIAKQKIVQEEAIKACGGYQIKCKLGFEITGTIHVMVAEEKH